MRSRSIFRLAFSVLAVLAYLPGLAKAITFDPTNKTQVLEGSNLVIQGLLDYCPYAHNVSGAIPGMFQEPYYWWEAGVAWGALIDWATLSGNTTYNDMIRYGMEFQSGQYWNFMTFNQTSVEGNDDQGFWGIAAMDAAEKNFTRPTKGYPDWLYFAQATFNTMAARWDNQHCGGGLRWQIYTWNAGYDYKNMVSNGCLFHLAARLARFTNNQTYVGWANRVWDWAWNVKFLVPFNNDTNSVADMQVAVLDGSSIDNDCSQPPPYEWTYDAGLMIAGCAYMYNYTGDPIWKDRVQGIWGHSSKWFFAGDLFDDPNKVAYESSCQTADASKITCNNDQRCFKGVFLRFLGLVLRMVPESNEWIWDYVLRSAQAASWSCSGGSDGHTCGLSWLQGGYDNIIGMGEQICALDAFNSLLIYTYPPPYTAKDLSDIYGSGSQGGNSSNGSAPVYGDGQAGLNSSTVTAEALNLDGGDRAGAGVLTAIVLVVLIACSGWLLL